MALALILFACNREEIIIDDGEENLELESRGGVKVSLCHFDKKKGIFKPQLVDIKDVAKHLAHGDYLLDADKDGYSAPGACSGTQNDCDDTNPLVNIAAAENCINGIDDDCDGLVDCEDPDCDVTCASICFTLDDLSACESFTYVCFFDSATYGVDYAAVECALLSASVSAVNGVYSVFYYDQTTQEVCSHEDLSLAEYELYFNLIVQVANGRNDCLSQVRAFKSEKEVKSFINQTQIQLGFRTKE